MDHTHRITEEEVYDDAPFGSMDPEGRSRVSHHSALLGIGAGIGVGLLLAAGALWAAKGSFAFGVSAPQAVASSPAPRPLALASAGMDVTETARVAPSGALEISIYRIFLTSEGISGVSLASATVVPGPADAAATVKIARSVPLPQANPLFAGRGQNGVDSLKALADADQGGAPLPQRNPLSREQRLSYAALPDPTNPLADTPAPAGPGPTTDPEEVALPTPGSGYALYDIKGKMVYMPDGSKLEAHSGYGEMFDDPKQVHRRMIGPTPPNVYSLTMREALFHGVEAIRMNPVGPGKMYGRAGILAHTYMLGPRGDSNGCVSFKDYEKFLTAFKRGEIKKMVVVAQLQNAPKEPSSLFSWLKPQ
ncbi:tlde1 domain-containing protein [Xanthobacter autotrophicus DSM 431]|uniref:DUF2778 domain-containing protein n=1 Tax=Xanthobacter nonsaccharivorans TaxID=3119912 RepID=UPI0037294292